MPGIVWAQAGVDGAEPWYLLSWVLSQPRGDSGLPICSLLSQGHSWRQTPVSCVRGVQEGRWERLGVVQCQLTHSHFLEK